jgi:hypothetical protein
MSTSKDCLLFTLENVQLTSEARSLAEHNRILDGEKAFWDALRVICRQCPKCLANGLGPTLSASQVRVLDGRLAAAKDRRLRIVAHRLGLYREATDILMRQNPMAAGQYQAGLDFMHRVCASIAEEIGQGLRIVA